MSTLRLSVILQLIGVIFGFSGLIGNERLSAIERRLRERIVNLARTAFKGFSYHDFEGTSWATISIIFGSVIIHLLLLGIITLLILFSFWGVIKWLFYIYIIIVVIGLVYSFWKGDPDKDIKAIVFWPSYMALIAGLFVGPVLIYGLAANWSMFLYIIVFILLSPYLLADRITLNFKLSSTLALIGFVLTFIGTAMQLLV